MRLCSWNINGIKSLLTHNLEELNNLRLDVLLLQEVRTSNVELIYHLAGLLGFPHIFYNLSEMSGRAGVATLSRIPSSKQFIPSHILPSEGRVLVTVIDSVCIVNLYSPYIGQCMVNKVKRQEWEEDISKFLYKLHADYPKMVIGGDLNVAPTKYDRYRVSPNQPGCNQLEADMFKQLIENVKLRDAYREIHGEEAQGYTWGMIAGRLRIDYFLVSSDRSLWIKGCEPIYDLYKETNGTYPSDHHPLILDIEVL